MNLAQAHLSKDITSMGLVEYPHFFRYIHHIFKADRAKEPLNVGGTSLDEAKLKRLMLQVISKVLGLTPSSRLPLMPYMMPGSQMPRMVNITPYRFPSKVQLAMAGLTSVYLKGLPVYAAHETPTEDTPMSLQTKPGDRETSAGC